VAAFVYDAVLALAIAIHAAGGGDAGGGAIYDALINVSFEGASGRVAFDATTGDREAPTLSFALDNWVEEGGVLRSVPAASFSLVHGLRRTEGMSIHWVGGASRQPDDRYEPEVSSLGEQLRRSFLSARAVVPVGLLLAAVGLAVMAHVKLKKRYEYVRWTHLLNIVMSSFDVRLTRAAHLALCSSRTRHG
jgi:hypothetical protein